MNDKICLVTGANSAIGVEICKGLAERWAAVVMVSRNARKGEDVMARVQRETGSDRIELLLGVSGCYFDKRAERTPQAAARDEAAAERLWEVSEQLVERR